LDERPSQEGRDRSKEQKKASHQTGGPKVLLPILGFLRWEDTDTNVQRDTDCNLAGGIVISATETSS
jgi:hypothetical protein